MVAEHGIPPQERIPEKICEQIIDVFVSQVVEQVTGLPKNSSQDRNLQGTVEQIPDDPMLEKAEQLVEVPEIVSRDGVQQRIVEQIIDAPVPQAVEELAEVSKVSSQDGIQQRIVEQTIPAFPLAEMIVKVPVIQTPERTQQVVNTSVQHVVNAVEVEKSEIIEETGQKPIIQEKIDQVTKHVEIPELQFTDKVVDVPVVARKQISTETVQKTIEISQLQVDDKMVDVPVMLVVLVPQVRIVKKTVEDSQLQIVEKTIENPETQISEVVTDACLTCDVKCKVACETCVKDNMFMVTGEMTVAGKRDHETVTHKSDHDCGRFFHVDGTSGSMHQQHTPGQTEEEREREEEDGRRRTKRRGGERSRKKEGERKGS